VATQAASPCNPCPIPAHSSFYLNLGFTDTQERDGDLSNLELSPESGRKHI